MAFLAMQDTNEPSTFPDLHLVSEAQWVDANDSGIDDLEIAAVLTEILGYDPNLIRTGATTQASPNAHQVYRALMQRTLGYVLEETPKVTRLVQAALDEIASGRTSVALSAEELEQKLRGTAPAD